jgi:hypothetical protein
MPFRDNIRRNHPDYLMVDVETRYGTIHTWSRYHTDRIAKLYLEIDEADNFVLPSGNQVCTVPGATRTHLNHVGSWSPRFGWWQKR